MVWLCALAQVLTTHHPFLRFEVLIMTFLLDHNPKLDLNPQRLQIELQQHAHFAPKITQIAWI